MATLSIRLDNKTKDDFAKFCDTVGMFVSTLFSVFVKTVVREQRIPTLLSLRAISLPMFGNSVKSAM